MAAGVVVYLVGLTSGVATSLDESWLVEYDPTRPGVGPRGEPMTAHLVTTTDPAKARVFADFAEAQRYTRASGPLSGYQLLTSPVSSAVDAL